MSGPFAFVTLVTSDSYLPGALVVAAGLRDLHPSPPTHPEVDFKTVCLVTPEVIDVKSIKALRKAFDLVVGVEVITSQDSQGLQLLGRPDLNTAMTKLHVFRLTEFSKVIFLDADILPVQPLSHLFLTPHEFSACPDVGWPDIFNSGVMVLTPGEDKFQEIMELFKTKGSWDGADQGLLNEWTGPNWNRLSFTYNTTPTAAYTYAPAYARFGSSIKAIHFIGPNKPWNSIPWRAPIEHPSADSMNSYGYSNLVDRWYAVYDRHYRPSTSATEEEYRTQHYEPAWETATFDNPTPTFSLEGLRRMAIEGVSSSAAVAEGEAEYKTMPLEGRIDLMRLHVVNQQQETSSPGDQSTVYFSAEESQEPHEEYRPSGREGLPSYLYRAPVHHEHHVPHVPSFPESRSHDHGVEHEQHHQHHSHEGHSEEHHHHHESHEHVEDHLSEYRPPSPPMVSWNPALEPPPHDPPPMVMMEFGEQQYQNVWDLPPSRPMQQHHHHQEYRDPWAQQPSYGQPYHQQQPEQHQQQQQSHQYYQQPHQYQPPPSHRPPSPHSQQQQQQHQSHEGHHHHSHHHHQQQSHYAPWGGHQQTHHQPSHSLFYPGPPHVEHPQYQPYPDTYHGQEVHHPPTHHVPRPEDFFHEPAPSKIPAHLLREGHYTAVISDEPKPDQQKVAAIFPWEQRNRPAPRRVFPDWDPKPPRLQSPPKSTVAELEAVLIAEALLAESMTPPVVDPVPERRRSPSPPPHVRRKFNPPPSPPERQGGTYVNAWDTDLSIQRYASVLAGRSSPFTPQPWPTHPGQVTLAEGSKKSPPAPAEDEEEYTNWVERAEASSRDGDDEEDEDEEALLSPRSAAKRREAKQKGNRYRHQGVQTDPKHTESRGVQVSIITEATKSLIDGDTTPPRRPQYISRDTATIDNPMPDPKRVSMATSSNRSSYVAPSAMTAVESQHPGVGNGNAEGHTLRKRESSEDSVTTAADSSIISSPTKELEEAAPPKVQIKQPEAVENPVAGRGSGIIRRVGRVFSPTTGMEIFKRGSEEVLARFLLQSPGGWEATRNANGPATPSAIQ